MSAAPPHAWPSASAAILSPRRRPARLPSARAWPARFFLCSPLLTPALPARRWLPPWPNRRFSGLEGGRGGREAWAGHDLLSDGRPGQSFPV